MAVAQLALAHHLAAEAEPASAGTIGVVVLAVIAGLELALLIACARVGRSGPEDDDPGSDDDGPGWGDPQPRTPPPDAPVCWPEFERQFAEYVAAQAGRGRQAPASSSSGRGRRAFVVRPERNVASAQAAKQAAPAAVVQLAAARSSTEPSDGTT